MNRKVLLIEPNYKNKYPPMGLMKLASYYRKQGDDVRFFKGDLKLFAARLLCEEFLQRAGHDSLGKYFPKLIDYIKKGTISALNSIPLFHDSDSEDLLREYRCRYRKGDFPKFDIVGVTTLFTFYWRETIATINYAKLFCADDGRMLVGGIAATILHEQMLQETGINPICGLLNKPGMLDSENEDIIDELPLDYSILEEIDYAYPANNAYFAYMTRGCPRKCKFCAVPRLEPEYKNYIGLQKQIEYTSARFGPMKDLLLMDNNVFASSQFSKIIDEIKACGFERGATYVPRSEYEIAMKNIADGFNTRGYKRKFIKLYDQIEARLTEVEQATFYLQREKRNLLFPETASTEAIIGFDDIARPLYNKHFKQIRRNRIIDFNQGVDARLVDESKMRKLSEVNIKPLRIAFDHYSMKETYEASIRLAAKYNIRDLSNYLLYNFEDHPDELYYRMKLNVDLCEELDVRIFSFPMKYHPIDDPNFFDNREFVGKLWSRKFIRAVQAVLNSTKGKIGSGKSFFSEAFGEDLGGYHKILWMPEAFIIHRRKYRDNLTTEWWEKYTALNSEQLVKLQTIVSRNRFDEKSIMTDDPTVCAVLEYYKMKLDDQH